MIPQIVERLSKFPVIENCPSKNRERNSAAVLVILKDFNSEPALLLTKRSKNLRHHAGQVAFPGGMWEEDDQSLLQTAVREASEEIGLSAESIECFAMMPKASPWRRDIDVTPFISRAVEPLNLKANVNEIEAIFDVPLQHFLDIKNYQYKSMSLLGGYRDANFQLPFIEYNDNQIWGFTLKVITDLVALISDEPLASIWK